MGVIAKSGACVISIVTQISSGTVTARNIYWQKGLNIKYLGGLNTWAPFQVAWRVMGCCTTPGKKAVTHLKQGCRVLWECVVISSRQSSPIAAPKIASQGPQLSNYLTTKPFSCSDHKAIRRTNNKKNNGWTCHTVFPYLTKSWHAVVALCDLVIICLLSLICGKWRSSMFAVFLLKQAFTLRSSLVAHLKSLPANKKIRKTSQCFYCSCFP